MFLELTDREACIIMHRLTVPDAIADVLYETSGWSREQVHNKVSEISNGFTNGGLKVPEGTLAKEILIECIEGSTWIGCMIGECSESTISKHVGVMVRLAKRMEELFGESVVPATC